MRPTLILLALALAASPAYAGRAIKGVARTYSSVGIRAIGQEPSSISPGQTVEAEVLSTSKLSALGFSNVAVGDHLTITGITDTEYSLTLRKQTIKVVAKDGTVELAK